MRLDASASDAAAMVWERCDAWQAAASAAGVKIRPQSTEDELPVAIAEGELAQVLDVLLDNAIKYAGEGARVDVTCRASGAAVGITVADNGAGLPPEDLAKATRRFWRSAAAGAGGTGLGLAIAERLVTARGGEIRIDGVEPHGLAVHVTLPLER
ncbi:hypothetical protein GCM10029964_044930 [Kibdelosporangium lantanae]